MRSFVLSLLLFSSLFSIKFSWCQPYYAGVPVYDTVVFGNTNYLYNCPSGELTVDPAFVNQLPLGLNLYFKLTSSQLPANCFNLTGIGVLNVGDSVQVTASTNQFEWWGLCGNGFASYVIFLVGNPVNSGDSIFCKSQWYGPVGISADGCTNYFSINYFPFPVYPQCAIDSITTSLGNEMVLDLRIFPNPFSNTATLSFPVPGYYELRVFDVAGKLVDAEFISGNQFIYQRRTLQSGLYFYEVRDGKNKVAKGKLIAEK